MQSMSIDSNAITGRLPAQYSTLTQLTRLNLGYNMLTSTISTQWTAMTAINRLLLVGNTAMCGPLPGLFASAGKVSATETNLNSTCPSPPSPPPAPPTPPPQPPSPGDSLYALRLAVTVSSWDASGLTGWVQGTNVCSWAGVTCGSGAPVSLELGFNSLSGTLPTQLAAVSTLSKLDLSSNLFRGR